MRKLVISALGLLLFATSGLSFYQSRRLEEPVVLSDGVPDVKKLGDYFEGIRGTVNTFDQARPAKRKPPVASRGGTSMSRPAASCS